MKIVCLDADTLGVDADFSALEALGEFISYKNTKNSETIERLKNADIVITNKVLIAKEVIENTNLKMIAISATGMNNVDLKAAAAKNITVKNVAGYSTNSVVQQTFASLFEMLNKVSYYSSYCKNGEWVKSEIFTHLSSPITEIFGKEFGVVGLGTIGKNVAEIASAFGANVRYYSTSGMHEDDDFISVSLDSLLKTSDILSIHAPLNERTKNLIGENEIAKMKDGAILMNFGRGGIVDENALAKAVDEKNLHVILDVLEIEPMKENHPLLNVKNGQNVLITPHIAWASVEARKKLVELLVKNIKDFINGK